jgi:CRP-like cAMP-binding protein
MVSYRMPSERDRAMIRKKLDVELADDAIDLLLSKMDRLEGAAGTNVLERDKASDKLMLLIDGTLVAHVDAEGRKLVLGRMEPGDWIGELQFIERGTSSATVTSESPFVALTLAGDSVDTMIEDNPLIASALIRTLSREIAERLARTSAGVLERVTDDGFRVADAEQRRGWFRDLLSSLFRRGGGAA